MSNDPSPRAWPGRAFRLPWRAPSEIDADLDAELEFHLDQRVAELTARGLSPAAAREEALRRFGDLEGARAYCRTQDLGRSTVERRRDWLGSWRQDLGSALRQLRRGPGFALVAIATIALGIGANTAIFSVVHRMLLAPLPYPEGDRLVALMESGAKNQMLMTPRSEVLDAWRSRARTLDALEPFDETDLTLGGSDEPEAIPAGRITPTLPGLLGVTPVLGRGFLPEDARPGATPVVMLGYGVWQRRFGGLASVLGTPLLLNGTAHTIVGVMPRGFQLPFMRGGAERQLWLPLLPNPTRGRGAERVQAIARLRPGITTDSANAELTAVLRSLPDGSGDLDFAGRAVRPQDLLGDNVRDALVLLFAVVGVVLLIACANVANLLLARASARSRELAIRAALGAGRGRLIRQLLTESLGLALLGGLVGVLLADRGLHLLVSLRPESLSELDDVRLEPIALAWSLGLSFLTGFIFGVAPAWFATDRNLGDALRSSAGSGGHAATRRLRAALVVAEVALSVALLIGAGLLIRTVTRMQQTDLGFQPAGLTDLSLALPPDTSAGRIRHRALYQEIEERVRAMPGVAAVVLAGGVPPRGGVAFGTLEVEGRTLGDGEATSLVGFTQVGAGFFALLHLPILEGGTFTADTSGHPVIINASMARRFWPGGSALGRRYRMGPDAPWQTVVGVVGDVRIPGPRSGFGDLQSYAPLDPSYEQTELLLRIRGDDASALPAVRAAIEAVAPGVRVSGISSVASRIAGVIAGPRFSMALFAAFALLALVLASIGLYGVISYAVGQRTREIGVRIALGASGGSVVRLVVSQGMRLTLMGVGVGLLGAGAGTRLMRSMLFEVDPLDPLTFGLVALLLVLVATAAAWLPARRAAAVDPVQALRSD